MSVVLDNPLELWPTSSLDEKQAVIRAVYKQVLGNPHVMESERLVTAESQLTLGEITVREFVREVAKSDFYRSRYFETCAPYRFVELNFKHLLGRAPVDQAELSEHITLCIEQGYDAEIDSYIDSVEYQEKFGDNIVPYYQGSISQIGLKQVDYNRTLSLYQGNAGVDSAFKGSRLVQDVATNSATKIKLPSTGGRVAAYQDATEKTFEILVTGSKFDCPRHVSTTRYLVSGAKMTPQIQRIHRAGGKIVSITEVA
ncbi:MULTISPECIES: phycobilisome rod-core linker polypeptide [unclassified Roseofilum]|uniref:phycobilisome rod-core linker polypeptide n=1 Tax=unclassified Roseofilum TaxID=2620099 RepID=UPI000E801497|nr:MULTISPECIES: phycobilisome rod-core linker polypeptide [unclassified Roseofilum]HBQ98592.1 photosystem I reaction center subunit XII [Cyanobacteria bacterium UBA11691]MBP0008596.1 phycobilisome rod-core linker polypeptide [Roseofilum sp. Belize Diploria]MBP0015424.1 phycobilisome rod-core linker polypeptide [Roseofilum sp. SID3]MBP0025425.1 phycobilisome rod-core linker polypeptide [Roseofilum sp. SID2]MBP0033803.1 phycobilisome rod-core linker polypeptide [Roseofilum sp. Belize BBD 4]